MEEAIIRDSLNMVEHYIEEDMREFISVEKYRLLETEAMSTQVCTQNQIHIGIKVVDGKPQCDECGSEVNIIKRVK